MTSITSRRSTRLASANSLIIAMFTARKVFSSSFVISAASGDDTRCRNRAYPDSAFSERFTTAILSRLNSATVAGLEALTGLGADGQDPASGAWLAELKADPAGR